MVRPMTPRFPSLAKFDNEALLQLWAKVMHELRERDVIRSANNPLGDYCEVLVAAHFEVEPIRGSNAGYDLITADGIRVQVKGRRITRGRRPGQFSVIRNLDARDFDVVIALVLNEDFTVSEAWSLSWAAVKRHARYSAHVNGWRLPMIRGQIREDTEVKPLDLQRL